MLEWIRNKVPSTSNEGRSQTDTSHKALVEHKQLSSGSIRLPKIQRRWSLSTVKKSVNGRASVNSTAEIQYRTPSIVSVKEASLISEEGSSFSSDANEEHIPGNVINCHPDKDVDVTARNSSKTRRAPLNRRSVKPNKAPPPPLHDSMASKSVGGNSAKVHTSSPIRPKSRGTDESEKTTQAVATITDDSSQTEPSEPALDITEAINHLRISRHSSRFREEVQESKANQDLRGGLSSVSADLFIARCESADGSNIVEDRSRDSSDSENEETYTKTLDIASGPMLVKEDDPEQPIKRIQKTTSEDIHLLHTTSEQSVISSRSYSAKDVTNSTQNDHQLIRPEGDVLRPAQQGSIDFDTHSNLPPVYDISLEHEDVTGISMPKTREQRFYKRKRQEAAISDHPQKEYPHKHHSKEHRQTIDINEVYARQYKNNEDVIVEGVLESVEPPLVDNDVPGSSQLQRNEDRTATQLPTSSYSSAQEDAKTSQTSSKIDEVKKQGNQLKSSEDHHDEFAQRSFKKILSVLNDLHEVQEEMKTFSGTEASDRDYVYMDEVMMRNLIKLDNIETKGNKAIKDERKKAIQTIQGMMLELERKLQENQDKQKDNVPAAPGHLKNTKGNKEDNSMNTESEETLSEIVTQK